MPKRKLSEADDEGPEAASEVSSNEEAIEPRATDVLFGRGDSINRYDISYLRR